MNSSIRYTIIAIITALVQLSWFGHLDLVLMTMVFIAFDQTVEGACIFAFTATVITALLTGVLLPPLSILLMVGLLVWFVIRTLLATKTFVSLIMLGIGAYCISNILMVLGQLGAHQLWGTAQVQMNWPVVGQFFYKLLIDVIYLLILYLIFSRPKYAQRAFLITGA